MAEAKPIQGVKVDIGAEKGKAWMTLSTQGVPPVTIALDPQAAFEMGESLARAAHTARFGKQPKSDASYLHAQIKSKVTEELRNFLARRIEVMLHSLREDKTWSHAKLAGELVDTVLTKVE